MKVDPTNISSDVSKEIKSDSLVKKATEFATTHSTNTVLKTADIVAKHVLKDIKGFSEEAETLNDLSDQPNATENVLQLDDEIVFDNVRKKKSTLFPHLDEELNGRFLLSLFGILG